MMDGKNLQRLLGLSDYRKHSAPKVEKYPEIVWTERGRTGGAWMVRLGCVVGIGRMWPFPALRKII